MHAYTMVQVVALAILWIVNESVISLSFPFFLILMVSLRKALEHFYTPSELEAVNLPKILKTRKLPLFFTARWRSTKRR